ncbi:YihY/virulence factor BrkB family protein [Microbacterium sp. EF45047]|nr:YihY/virulence factor BrkB family protein [Microbacterium sp. EF45047]
MGSRRRIAAHIVRRVVHGFTANECPNAAAGLAFYALLALFPTLIAGFALVGLFGRRRDAERVVLDLIGEVLSPEVAAAVQEPIEELATASGAGVALTIGLVIALWTVARYITALGRTMNGVYGVTEGRPYWKAKPAHLLVTVLVFVLVLAAVSLAVASWPLAQALADLLGAGEPVLAAWRILRWPALLLLVVLVVAVLYYFAPNVEQPRFRWVSVGAVIAIAVLAAASAAFGFFAVGIADYGGGDGGRRTAARRPPCRRRHARRPVARSPGPRRPGRGHRRRADLPDQRRRAQRVAELGRVPAGGLPARPGRHAARGGGLRDLPPAERRRRRAGGRRGAGGRTPRSGARRDRDRGLRHGLERRSVAAALRGRLRPAPCRVRVLPARADPRDRRGPAHRCGAPGYRRAGAGRPAQAHLRRIPGHPHRRLLARLRRRPRQHRRAHHRTGRAARAAHHGDRGRHRRRGARDRRPRRGRGARRVHLHAGARHHRTRAAGAARRSRPVRPARRRRERAAAARRGRQGSRDASVARPGRHRLSARLAVRRRRPGAVRIGCPGRAAGPLAGHRRRGRPHRGRPGALASRGAGARVHRPAREQPARGGGAAPRSGRRPRRVRAGPADGVGRRAARDAGGGDAAGRTPHAPRLRRNRRPRGRHDGARPLPGSGTGGLGSSGVRRRCGRPGTSGPSRDRA